MEASAAQTEIPRANKELKEFLGGLFQTREDHNKESGWFCEHRVPFTSSDPSVSVTGEFARFRVGKDHILICGERGKPSLCLTDLHGNIVSSAEVPSTRSEYSLSVREIYLSPDDALAAIEWFDGMMEVWKTQPFEHIKTFGADVKDKLRVAVGLLPNGQYLMSGNDLALIDANNNVVRTWAIPKSVYCIDIYYPPQAEDGKEEVYLLYSNHKKVLKLDLTSAAPPKETEFESNKLDMLCLHPTMPLLLIFGSFGNIVIFNTHTGDKLAELVPRRCSLDDFKGFFCFAGEYGEYIVGVNADKEKKGLMIVPWILGNEATPVYLDTLGSERFQWAHNRLNVLSNGGALMDSYTLKTAVEYRRLEDQEWKALWGGGFEKPMTSEEFKESVKSLPPSAFRPYSKFTNHNVIYGSSALVSPCLTKIALHRGEKMAVVSLQGGEIVERPDESANLRSLGFLRDWSPDGVFFLANVEAISSDIRQLSIWKTVPELSLEATVADQITTPRGSMAFRTDGMFLSNNTYITVQARQNSPSLIQLWELPTHESLRRWLVFNAWLTQLEAYRGTQGDSDTVYLMSPDKDIYCLNTASQAPPRKTLMKPAENPSNMTVSPNKPLLLVYGIFANEPDEIIVFNLHTEEPILRTGTKALGLTRLIRAAFVGDNSEMIALLDSKYILKFIRTDDGSEISTIQVDKNLMDSSGTFTYVNGGTLYWSYKGLYSWSQEKEN